MSWVKLHDDILADPKLLRAARAGHQHLVLLPWLLVFARHANDGGRISVGQTAADPHDIAHQLPGVDLSAVSACLKSLTDIGVLSPDPDGCLRFVKWQERQAKPSAAKSAVAERVRNHRQKKKGGKSADSPSSDPVTPSEALQEKGDVTPCNATEQKRGEEKRRENTNSMAAGGVDVTPQLRGMAYTVRCASALNLAMQANSHVQAFREIPASSLVGQVEWDLDGIDVSIAQEVITAVCAQYRPKPGSRQINSLKYFDGAVRARWSELQAQGLDKPEKLMRGARNLAEHLWFKKRGYA
jgi:hypothetical protein